VEESVTNLECDVIISICVIEKTPNIGKCRTRIELLKNWSRLVFNLCCFVTLCAKYFKKGTCAMDCTWFHSPEAPGVVLLYDHSIAKRSNRMQKLHLFGRLNDSTCVKFSISAIEFLCFRLVQHTQAISFPETLEKRLCTQVICE